jgi:hypothetical protein
MHRRRLLIALAASLMLPVGVGSAAAGPFQLATESRRSLDADFMII